MAEREKFLPKDVVVQKGPNRGRIAPIGLAHTIAIKEDNDRSELIKLSTERIEELIKELDEEYKKGMSEEQIAAAWTRFLSDLNLQIEVGRRAKEAIEKAGLKISKEVKDTLIKAVSDEVLKEHRKQTKKRKRKEATSGLMMAKWGI